MTKYKEDIQAQGKWRFITLPNLGEVPQGLFELLRSVDKSENPKKVQDKIKELFGIDAKVHAFTNVVTTAGRNAMLKAVAGEITSVAEAKINYEELGIGTTTPAAGDTGLETPDASTRQPISSVASSGTKLNINSFWAAGNATGTWREYGCFINGTSTSNSGILFVHVGINITVGSADALVIDGTITLNN